MRIHITSIFITSISITSIFITTILIFCFLSSCYGRRHKIVVIDPAGHAGCVGRWLVESSERAETLKFARELKKEIVNRYGVKAIVSRSPGEELLALQIPSFSNRLNADFFLRINMCREEGEKPKVFFYNLLFDSLVDLAAPGYVNDIELISLYQAHIFNINKTILYGNQMYEYLSQYKLKKYFDCYPLRGLPLKHLVGITAPAILLEIGLCRENKWRSLVRPIANSLSFLEN